MYNAPLPDSAHELKATLDAYFEVFPGEEQPPHEWLLQEPERALSLYGKALRQGRAVVIEPDTELGLDVYKSKLGKKIV